MKVLSILQPWATLIVIGAKKIETRSWDTKYCGTLLIHASIKMKKQQIEIIKSESFCNALKQVDELRFGMIIGKVELTGTTTTDFLIDAKNAGIKLKNIPGVKNDQALKEWDKEIAFGDYSPGRYGWLLKDPVQFEESIQAKGSLGLWNFSMCKKCGCHEEDACIHPVFGNCFWVAEDLCSHCVEVPGESKRYSQLIKEKQTFFL